MSLLIIPELKKPYVCTDCQNKRFKSLTGYKVHLVFTHGHAPSSARYRISKNQRQAVKLEKICYTCNLTFNTHGEYRLHCRTAHV